MKQNLIHAWIDAKSKGDHALVCYISYLLRYSEEGKKQMETRNKMAIDIGRIYDDVFNKYYGNETVIL